MSIIINFTTTEELDESIIPWDIYNETINKQKLKIQSYFILHPKLLFSFVGYNGALKLANQLASNKKCGCLYTIPWKTYYDEKNNTKKTTLTFTQQVDEYRYMILYWNPSPKKSYMQYLSQIALGMILQIKLYTYSLQNNLEYCTIFREKYYTNNFQNVQLFKLYIYRNLANIDLKYINLT
jgi:hypothetical protein